MRRVAPPAPAKPANGAAAAPVNVPPSAPVNVPHGASWCRMAPHGAAWRRMAVPRGVEPPTFGLGNRFMR